MSTATNTEVTTERLQVKKTYKLYIGGKFPRTESGRHYQISSGENICQGSRKDIREAVVAARAAFSDWSSRTAFNRGQILYRMAEMLEDRGAQFVLELKKSGQSEQQALQELSVSIDRLVYYAGFADKFQSIISSVNPVSASYFNFSVAEPMGVIGISSGEQAPLLSFVSCIAPVLAAGNTCVLIPAEKSPTAAMTFAEVLATSDLPAGVINIVTGFQDELLPQLASHMDVNAILACHLSQEQKADTQKQAVRNLKRTLFQNPENWLDDAAQGLRWIQKLCETKTTWHPIGV